MNLPADIRREVERLHGAPLEFFDQENSQRYVLIRADLFERLKSIFDDRPLSAEQRRALLREAGQRAGWDDPEMDVYNDLDPRRSP